MKVHQFLDHYGISENPFAQEDAGADRVFLDHCLTGTHHSSWDKVYGDPRTPSTSIVFGEQGSGKTAMRLQIVGKLQQHNREHPRQRAFIVEYDNFNPFLDSFRERLGPRQRKIERALSNWQLWDHMDAILTLSTTRLADAIRNGPEHTDEAHRVSREDLQNLNHLQQRDILLLAACYDNNRDYSPFRRWSLLRSKLRYSTWRTWWPLAAGIAVTVAVIAMVLWLGDSWRDLLRWWVPALIFLGWVPFLWKQWRSLWSGLRIKRQIRIFDHQAGTLRKILNRFSPADIVGQPLPTKARGDDRYELLMKLQSVLGSLGFSSLVVLVDRVDEPHLVNGNAQRMRDLIWPMFDNKFLKHPGIAFKLLLPEAVSGYLQREEKEFYERSRLDKQNLIPSLKWTGQGLYDIANDRIRACAKLAEGKPPSIRNFFEDSISEGDLIAMFDRLRAPRHLFKYLYRLLVDHCAKYTEDRPEWKIRRETMDATLAVFLRDLAAYDAKQGTG